VCGELAPIELSKPSFADAGGDGQWNPGEWAAVFVTMTNTSDAQVNYPGITMTSDNPLVSAANPYGALFTVLANKTGVIDVTFEADAAVPKGTSVHFVATLTDIQGNVCDELPALELDIVIE